MTRYRFEGSQPLDFPNLEHADGIGLHLDPGDIVDLDAKPVGVYLDGDEIGRHHPGTPWLVPDDAETTLEAASGTGPGTVEVDPASPIPGSVETMLGTPGEATQEPGLPGSTFAPPITAAPPAP